MKCNQVIALLSRFHDGELPEREWQAVNDHLGSCAACAGSLESISRLSALVSNAPSPSPPSTFVDSVGQALDSQRKSAQLRRRRFRLQIIVAALAASLLGGVLVWSWRDRGSNPLRAMAGVVGKFLETYEHDPKIAAQVLTRQYQGAVVSATEASRALKRESVAPATLFATHRLAERYLLKTPCCDCLLTTYSSDTDPVLILFEHEKEQPEWFGQRPLIRTHCRGKACCIVELEGSLAATWRAEKGQITVIGVKKKTDVDQLVSELHAGHRTDN